MHSRETAETGRARHTPCRPGDLRRSKTDLTAGRSVFPRILLLAPCLSALRTHPGDAVADGELPLERFFGGVVLDAEELPQIEPRLVDVVVVVLDEAGALAHHALAEPVHQPGVVIVVSDGEQARALVVPGKRLFIVSRPACAHGRGERGEGDLGQQALVVAPGAGRGVVMDGDVVARLAVVEPPGLSGDAHTDLHGVVGEVHGVLYGRLPERKDDLGMTGRQIAVLYPAFGAGLTARWP